MTLEDRLGLLAELGTRLTDFNNQIVEMAITKAHHENQWFVPENSKKAINAISSEFLQRDKLARWINEYDVSKVKSKSIGLVLAGNIPMVGFHDLLCTFISGHNAVIKTSSKDDALVKLVLDIMNDIDSEVSQIITTTDRLSNYDAVIATGSNNTAQHFEYYFRKYPKVIRKNRVSVAVLGSEDDNDVLERLGSDVFDYFGLGCRNISKIFVPEDFNLDDLFEAFYPFKDIINHNKYNNNFTYNEAIWLMGQDAFLTNGFIILKEEKSIFSRIASLYYERYNNLSQIKDSITEQKENIQCVSSNLELDAENINTVSIGGSQCPSLSDYADHVDTMNFLINL